MVVDWSLSIFFFSFVFFYLHTWFPFVVYRSWSKAGVESKRRTQGKTKSRTRELRTKGRGRGRGILEMCQEQKFVVISSRQKDRQERLCDFDFNQCHSISYYIIISFYLMSLTMSSNLTKYESDLTPNHAGTSPY